jgi:hypothetical protein
MNGNTLIISDTQAPYHHPDALQFLDAVTAIVKPTNVVHVGDLIDGHTLGRFSKHPDAYGPAEEMDRAREFAQQLAARWPRLKICRGNHDERVLTAAHRAGIPTSLIRTLNEVLGTPKWQWSPSWEVPWTGGKALVYHGAKKKGAINRAKQIGQSVICGHWHALFGVEYFQVNGKMAFGMDVGTLSNADSPAMDYARECQFEQILGLAAIVDGWPRLYPMPLDKRRRWTGKLV